MNGEIIKPSNLLDDKGYLVQKGWARQLILKYEREKVKGLFSSFRIKEWDCYEIMNSRCLVTLIIADIGYFGMATIMLIDFEKKMSYEGGSLKLLTRGSLNLPPSANEGDAIFSNGHFFRRNFLSFKRDGDNIILSFYFHKIKGKKMRGSIKLYKDPTHDTMVNVIPFKNPRHFVYVQKANCMPAKGIVQYGDETYEFSEKNNSYACLDWSRGVFPYRTSWYWGSASGLFDGKPLGFNIDYGFGDETIATKNMIFYDGKGHKLDKITFHIPKNYWNLWRFTSNDGRFEMTLKPIFIKTVNVNAGILKTGGVNAYGYYKGEIILDDGKKLRIDKLLGFAERYSHRW